MTRKMTRRVTKSLGDNGLLCEWPQQGGIIPAKHALLCEEQSRVQKRGLSLISPSLCFTSLHTAALTLLKSLLNTRCTSQHYTTLHYTTQHYTTLHNTSLHYTTLPYTTLHYTIQHYNTLDYTTITTLHYPTSPTVVY